MKTIKKQGQMVWDRVKECICGYQANVRELWLEHRKECKEFNPIKIRR